MLPVCVTLSYFFQRSSLPDRFNSITYLLRHHSYTTGYTTACGCFAVRRPMTSAITNTNVNSRYERCNARYTIPIQPISLLLSHAFSVSLCLLSTLSLLLCPALPFSLSHAISLLVIVACWHNECLNIFYFESLLLSRYLSLLLSRFLFPLSLPLPLCTSAPLIRITRIATPSSGLSS